ncbi:pentatricopeptide repeat-containing protein At4g33170 [Selaginella moellendorffii]|uniref:pentatricopeptide repeat-containing protein At4g33170 n=1 Tax=Selaginella moellendorffii TaxID=88036 RepID=UPI000D1D055D|nr:pentatricopeptide repeat-containing protein At4g33170 [Selaginella moellendorffii]|eukprot:XP_024543344.1 pentatricopeptide repeat-containing protein At4g33170 [Selaginella moellendorffii]
MISLATQPIQHGHSEAIRLCQRMEPDGVEPDEITYVTCDMQSLVEGRPVHDRIVRAGLENGALVSTALVSMYGKCGSLDEARKIFDGSDLSNLVSWNAMIVAYAQNGEGKQGLELYELMNLDGVEPNGVTYTGVLFACAHAGLLDEAWKQFVSLKTDRGIEWEDEHFSCMTDMLGRLGRLEEAEEFLKRFPQAGGVPWLSLLNSCQMHGDLERGKRVSQEAMKRNPETSSSYVMLSNIYAAPEVAKMKSRLGFWYSRHSKSQDIT